MMDKAGETGGAAILQKLEVCRTWLKEKWEVDLDAMRAEVQKRQANLDWNYIMSLGFLHEDEEN